MTWAGRLPELWSHPPDKRSSGRAGGPRGSRAWSQGAAAGLASLMNLQLVESPQVPRRGGHAQGNTHLSTTLLQLCTKALFQVQRFLSRPRVRVPARVPAPVPARTRLPPCPAVPPAEASPTSLCTARAEEKGELARFTVHTGPFPATTGVSQGCSCDGDRRLLVFV